MGCSVIASCGCGVQEFIQVGGGMLTFTTECWFPAMCRSCHSLVIVNLLRKEMRCPKCGSRKVIPYDDPSLIRVTGDEIVASWNVESLSPSERVLTNGRYMCPKCGDPTLSFEDGGLMWD